MFKKIITIAFIITAVSQIPAFAELTPLQIKVREAFAKMKKEHQQIEEVAKVEDDTEIVIANENEEDKSTIAVTPANDDKYAHVLIASDQDEEDEEEFDEEEDEGEAIVVATAPTKETSKNYKAEKPRKEEVKTAAEASSKDRRANINKKWSFEALGWNSDLTGHIKIAENENALALLNDANGRIDLKSDTSIDKKKVPGLKLAYNNGGRSSVEFNWVNVKQDGHLNAGLNKEFRGKVYAADANFKINNAMYDLVWKYKFSHNVEASGREKSYVSGLLGIKASKMEFTFDGNATEGGVPIGNHHEAKSETIPVPYIGVEAGTYIGEKVYLKGHFRYLKLNNVSDYDAEHSDYDVSLSYRLSGSECNQDIFLDVGYRQVVYDVEGKGNDVELKYKGPYVGLEFRF